MGEKLGKVTKSSLFIIEGVTQILAFDLLVQGTDDFYGNGRLKLLSLLVVFINLQVV